MTESKPIQNFDAPICEHNKNWNICVICRPNLHQSGDTAPIINKAGTDKSLAVSPDWEEEFDKLAIEAHFSSDPAIAFRLEKVKSFIHDLAKEIIEGIPNEIEIESIYKLGEDNQKFCRLQSIKQQLKDKYL